MKIKRIISFFASAVCAAFVFSDVLLAPDAEAYSDFLTYGPMTYYETDEDLDGVYDYVTIKGCDRSVTEVEIPSEINGLPVGAIDVLAFLSCMITDIKIPDSVKTIGSDAFYCCGGLKSVEIPDGVTVIDEYTFAFCGNLESVKIPDSVTKIGYFSFGECTSLNNVVIPESVEIIGSNSFENCKSLTSITIPESVKIIEGYSFTNCDVLGSVTILNPKCEIFDMDSTISNGVGEGYLPYFNGTIYGYTNSTAEEYALKYGYNFVSIGEYIPEIIVGDITGDEVVNLYDVIEIAKYMLGMRDFTDEEIPAADYNGDGIVNLYDAIAIAQYMMNS